MWLKKLGDLLLHLVSLSLCLSLAEEAFATGMCPINGALMDFLDGKRQVASTDNTLIPQGMKGYIANDAGREFSSTSVALKRAANPEEAVELLEKSVKGGNTSPRLRITWDDGETKSIAAVTQDGKGLTYKATDGSQQTIGLRNGARNEPMRSMVRVDVEVRQPVLVGNNSAQLSVADVDKLKAAGNNKVFFKSAKFGTGEGQLVTTYSSDKPLIFYNNKMWPLSNFETVELKVYVPLYTK